MQRYAESHKAVQEELRNLQKAMKQQQQACSKAEVCAAIV